MLVVDEHGLQLALQNPLPPNLFVVTGQWYSFGQDAIVLPCQGLSATEIIQILCSKLGAPDLLTRFVLNEKKLVVCVNVSLEEKGLIRLAQAPYILCGLRLVLANRSPIMIRCNSVSPLYIDVRLNSTQIVQILAAKLQAPEDFVSHVLKTVTTSNIDELFYVVSHLLPIYRRLLLDDPSKALQALNPYMGHTMLLHITAGEDQDWSTSGSSLPDLNRISMFILTASFLASYNPVGSDLQVFQHEKKKKGRKGTCLKTRRVAKAAKIPQLHIGPKEFALDRMLEILKKIGGDELVYRDVYTHISNLVAMKLLTIISANINAGRSVLDATKLRCLVSFHTALCIASKIDITLSQYLYNPSP